MKFRGLVVAALVLLVLVGALYWSGHHKPSGAATAPSAGASPAILKVNPASITRFTLKKRGADLYTVAKASSGNWQITEPESLGADESTVSGMISALSSVDSDRVVEDKAADLKQYGLDPPALEVDITANGNQTKRLLLGDDTPAGGDVYAMLAGVPKVFTASSYNKSGLDKSLNDVRDKRLVTLSADAVTYVELARKGQEIGLSRGKDGWQIVKPQPLRADSSAVDDLVRQLTDARMDLSGSGNEDSAAAFAHATPIATAKITGESGTQVLELRKNKDAYYAKSSAAGGAYKVESTLGQALDKNLDDFRNKKLFDFGFSDPGKIELHSGAKVLLFTRSGDDWRSNGEKVNAQSMESLISKLRDLTASKFAASGYTTPAFEATVTSDDGKRVEKVSIAKSGKNSIARRGNESSLYQLDPDVIDQLQQAAGEIKPVDQGAGHKK